MQACQQKRKETVKEKIETGEIIFNQDETGIIRKIYINTVEGRAPESIWFGKDTGTTREANGELKSISYYVTARNDVFFDRTLAEQFDVENRLILDMGEILLIE